MGWVRDGGGGRGVRGMEGRGWEEGGIGVKERKERDVWEGGLGEGGMVVDGLEE